MHVYQDVPFFLLEDGRVGVLANPDRVAFDDDFRAVDAVRAERDSDPFHVTSPPLLSMWGQIVAVRPSVERHVFSVRRSSRSIPSRSDAFCSRRRRTWTHGGAPARRSAMMCAIADSVSPSRRARPENVSRASVSGGYRRYPAGVRRGVGRMRRASYSLSAFRPTPLFAESSPTFSPSTMPPAYRWPLGAGSSSN